MSKYVIFTDLHLGVHNNSELMLNVSENLVKEIIDTYHKRNCIGIIFLGDFFHERKSVNIRTLSMAMKISELLATVPSWVIIGNHDTYYSKSLLPTSLEIMKNITVVAEPTVVENMTLLPWDCPLEEATTPILMGHFDIIGFALNNKMIADEHTATKAQTDFKKFDLVLSGHFHTPSKNRNIHYIGSCLPFTFADVDSPRGYHILDNETMEMEFIEFKDTPRFKIIRSDQEIVPQDITGNFIRVFISKDTSTEQAEKFLNELQIHKPLTTQVEYEGTETKIELNTTSMEFKSSIEIFEDFIEKSQLPTYINPGMLKKFIRNLAG